MTNRSKLLAVFAFVLVALAGCSTTHQYKRAAHELHVWSSHIWCWTPSQDLSAGYHGAQCETSTAPTLAEDACLQALAASPKPWPGMDAAMKEVESCMRAKGWSLFPIASYIETKPAPNCRLDEYRPDHCPNTAQ